MKRRPFAAPSAQDRAYTEALALARLAAIVPPDHCPVDVSGPIYTDNTGFNVKLDGIRIPVRLAEDLEGADTDSLRAALLLRTNAEAIRRAHGQWIAGAPQREAAARAEQAAREAAHAARVQAEQREYDRLWDALGRS